MTVKGELEIYSQVVRIEKIDSKEYMYGIEFNELGESKRDKIVQEVFW